MSGDSVHSFQRDPRKTVPSPRNKPCAHFTCKRRLTPAPLVQPQGRTGMAGTPALAAFPDAALQKV